MAYFVPGNIAQLRRKFFPRLVGSKIGESRKQRIHMRFEVLDIVCISFISYETSKHENIPFDTKKKILETKTISIKGKSRPPASLVTKK